MLSGVYRDRIGDEVCVEPLDQPIGDALSGIEENPIIWDDDRFLYSIRYVLASH